MDVYRRYFRVTSGPLIDAVESANQINSAAQDEYGKILKEIGAKPGYYHRGGKLIGIIFDTKPDSGLYKHTGNGWFPKRNCKAGKELAARFEAVKTSDPQKALRVIGLSDNPTIFGGGRCYVPTLTVIPENPPVIYLSVPWYDEDPSKIEQYKKDRAAGTRGSSNIDAILWESTPEMEEVKKWEVDRHIDEWNENIKAKNKAA